MSLRGRHEIRAVVASDNPFENPTAPTAPTRRAAILHAVRLTAAGAAMIVLSVAICAQGPDSATGAITYTDVQPLWDTLRPTLPAAVRQATAATIAETWRLWVRQHDAAIRARVARGDEDSLVNLWLFGTSFTAQPPARPRDVARYGEGATLAQIADRRFDDLVAAMRSPGANDRVRWAASTLGRRGIDLASAAGGRAAREFVNDIGKRMLSESADFSRVLESPNAAADPLAWMARYASLYHDRGLSSDTSILSSYAVDHALAALGTSGLLAGGIRRVAILGPGLDVINKADGHDFYPVQSIQPFATVDSLLRHGLARAGELSITTFDLSARVNEHLTAARDRAREGTGYLLHLPLGEGERWSRGLEQYWARAGDRVGETVRAAAAPRTAGSVKVRAVEVRPDVVRSVVPLDLNIVLERLEPLADDQRFDLVIATNVFVYYESFEQVLALVNIGRMLRPGGVLLSNQAVPAVPPLAPPVGNAAVTFSDRQFDYVFWYRRQ